MNNYLGAFKFDRSEHGRLCELAEKIIFISQHFSNWISLQESEEGQRYRNFGEEKDPSYNCDVHYIHEKGNVVLEGSLRAEGARKAFADFNGEMVLRYDRFDERKEEGKPIGVILTYKRNAEWERVVERLYEKAVKEDQSQ